MTVRMDQVSETGTSNEPVGIQVNEAREGIERQFSLYHIYKGKSLGYCNPTVGKTPLLE